MLSRDEQSRYKHARAFLDDSNTDQVTYLGTREPITYVDDRENSMHVASDADTLEALADRLFDGFDNPQSLYWVIGNYQPTPIMDPSRRLKAGTILIIPSRAFVKTLIDQNPLDGTVY